MNALRENVEISRFVKQELTERENLHQQEYLTSLAACLSQNINFNPKNSIYELSSLSAGLTAALPGNNEFFSKSYPSLKDQLNNHKYQKFSQLVFTHVLENVRNPNTFLRALSEKVADKQPVIFIVKNSLNALFIKLFLRPVGMTYKHPQNSGINGFNHFSLRTLKKLLSENGFKLNGIFFYQQGYSPELQLFSDILAEICRKILGEQALKDYEQEKNYFSFILVAHKITG